VEDIRPFPIQGCYHNKDRVEQFPCSTIPWWMAEIAYHVYARKFGELKPFSIEQVAEQGGFGRLELLQLLRYDV